MLATLVGGGPEDSGVVVRKLRLPRGLTGLLVGAGFGISPERSSSPGAQPAREPELVRDVFGLAAEVMPDPLSGTPLVLPVPTRPDDPQRSETTMTDETPSTAAATLDSAENGTDPVAEIMAAFGSDVLNRMNVDFEDSVLFVGRILGQRPAATAARITDIDRLGVEMVVTDPAGDHQARVDFVEAIAEIGQLTNELLGIAVRAREVSGEPGMTSGEREFVKLSGIRTFITEVISVSDVNAHCRQITFAGDDLGQFHLAGPDTFVYVLVPPPGRNDLTIDQSFSWDDYWKMPDDERPVGAYYTVRRWRPESNEVDILFVLHDSPGAASDWARRAQPGDPAALWGPRTSYEPPADADWYLLVADDTGLPAIGSILEQLPSETPARVYVEVDNPDEQHELASPPDVEVTWLYRNGAKPGTTSLLPDAVRRLAWPGGNPYVWGAGESHTMTQIRKYVRHELELSREAVMLEAYWRHSDYHGDDGDDGDGDGDGERDYARQ